MAYKKSIECFKKEKAARQQAKERAIRRARAKQSNLPNGNASHSGAADAGEILFHAFDSPRDWESLNQVAAIQ